MKLKKCKLKSAILLGLSVTCAGLMEMPAASAETLNIATQSDYDNNASNQRYGGYLFPLSSTSGNTVIIGQAGGGTAPVFSGGTVVDGGYAKSSADTSNNTVIVNSGSKIGSAGYNAVGVIGGNTWYGNADNNTVIINGGSIGGSTCGILGGFAQATGNARNNTVTINGGTINGGAIEGGQSGNQVNAVANNNTVTINGGTISNAIIEGAESGNKLIDRNAFTNNNTITINGGNLSNVTIEGAEGDNGSSDSNSVTINGGTISGTGNTIDGAWSLTKTTNNTVTINNGTISNVIIEGAESSTASATDNTVTINNGTISNGTIYGANGKTQASYNTVTINDGTISSDIYGGYSKAQASGNTVALNNGTIAGNIYGGYSTSSDQVTDNVVIINPGNDLNISDAALYGSNASHDQNSSGSQLGNTLDVYQKSITAKNVSNFSNINFYLPDSIQNGDTVLTLTGSTGTDVSNSNIYAYVPGSAKLTPGEKIVLLTNASGVTSANAKYSYSLTQGVSLTYDVYMGPEGSDSIVLDLIGATVNPKTKSLVETRTASIGFLNSGMDMVDDVIPTIDKGTYVPFFIAKGDDMRYNTGSYVKTHGSHEMLGAARKITEKDGAAYLAPFIEAGWGWYDSHVDGIRADGDISYYGLGFLARRSYNNGFYYEGSLHYGKTESSYNSNNLSGVSNEYYDMKTPYYSINFEIGKTKQLNANSAFDIYGEYFYTRENGDSAVLSSGETYDFDSIASNRVRIGTRYTRQYGSEHELYAGAAYEYEFSGSANASYEGYAIPDSSLKGSSGMLELGYKIFTPTANVKRPVSIDLSLIGWFGKKEGIMPKVTARWYI